MKWPRECWGVGERLFGEPSSREVQNLYFILIGLKQKTALNNVLTGCGSLTRNVEKTC